MSSGGDARNSGKRGNVNVTCMYGINNFNKRLLLFDKY